MPMPTDHVARLSLAEEAYIRIEAAIMDGTLEAGERLRDPDLVEWLGISRTPIRHALDRLSEQGLVEMERNRYTRVAAFDVDGALRALQVAGDLWGGAALRGLSRWDEQDDLNMAETTGDLLAAAAEDDVVRFASVFEHLVVAFARIEDNDVRIRALNNVTPQVHRLARRLRGRLGEDALRGFIVELRATTRARDGRAAATLIDDCVTRLGGLVHSL